MNNLKERNPLPNGVYEPSDDPPGFIYPSYQAAPTQAHRNKPSLNSSHQGVAYVSSSVGGSLSTLSFEDNGIETRVTPHTNHVRAIRGRIRGFSRASRTNLLRCLASINRSAFRAFKGRLIAITLTYPHEYPEDPELCKNHLNALRKRLQRKCGNFAGFWRLGIQRRGAFHFHLLHIKPSLGRVWLKKLTPAHVRGLHREKLDAGLAPATVRKIHSTLHKALSQAVSDGIVPRNAADVKAPRPTPEEMRPLSETEVRAFLDVARGFGDRFEALYVLAITTGLRRGELLGLRWDDMDMERSTLRVGRALVRGEADTPSVRPRLGGDDARSISPPGR